MIIVSVRLLLQKADVVVPPSPLLSLWQQHPVSCCDSMGRGGSSDENEAVKLFLLATN